MLFLDDHITGLPGRREKACCRSRKGISSSLLEGLHLTTADQSIGHTVLLIKTSTALIYFQPVRRYKYDNSARITRVLSIPMAKDTNNPTRKNKIQKKDKSFDKNSIDLCLFKFATNTRTADFLQKLESSDFSTRSTKQKKKKTELLLRS